MPHILRHLRGGPDVPVLDIEDERPSERQPFYVRISPLGSESLRAELRRVTSSGAAGVVLPGMVGRPDVERLGAMLAVAEAEADLPDGSLRILAMAADTPGGVLALPGLSATPRLVGLACDPDALAAALGCASEAPAIIQARTMTVLVAAACGVPAVLVGSSGDVEVVSEGFGAILHPTSSS